MSSYIVLPTSPDFTPAALVALKAANPGVATITVLPAAVGDVPPHTDAHRSAWITVCEWLKPLVAMGVGILVPGPLSAIVRTVLSEGIDAIEAKLSGEPAKERWTVDEMSAERDTIKDPTT